MSETIKASLPSLDTQTIIPWLELLPDDTRAYIAANAKLDQALAEKLANDPKLKVRIALMGSPNLPEGIGQAMLKASNEAHLVAAAARSLELTDEQFNKMVKDPRLVVRMGLLEGQQARLLANPDQLVELLSWATTTQLSNKAAFELPGLVAKLDKSHQEAVGADKLAQMAADGRIDAGALVQHLYSWKELWDELTKRCGRDYSLVRAAYKLLQDGQGGAISQDARDIMNSWNTAWQLEDQAVAQARASREIQDLPSSLATLDYSEAYELLEEYMKTQPVEDILGPLLTAVLNLPKNSGMDLYDWQTCLEPVYERIGAVEFMTMMFDEFESRGLLEDFTAQYYLSQNICNYTGSNPELCSRLASQVSESWEDIGPISSMLLDTQWAKRHPDQIPLPVLRAGMEPGHPGWTWLISECARRGFDASTLISVQELAGNFAGTTGQLVDSAADLSISKVHSIPVRKRNKKTISR